MRQEELADKGRSVFMSSNKGRFDSELSMSLIRVSEDPSLRLNVRSSTDAREDLTSLKESMDLRGLIHPIVVMEEQGKYEVIAGQRRYLAAKELGWKIIPAIIKPHMTDVDAKLISLHESFFRKPLSFVDRQRTAELLFEEYEENVDDLMRELGLDKQKTIALLEDRLVPKEVARLVDKHELTRQQARDLTQALWPDKSRIISIALKMVELTREERKHLTKLLSENPKMSTPEVLKEAKKPPITLKVVVTKDLVSEMKRHTVEYGLTINDLEGMARIALMEWLDSKKGISS